MSDETKWNFVRECPSAKLIDCLRFPNLYLSEMTQFN